jgi:hypothetical protein
MWTFRINNQISLNMTFTFTIRISQCFSSAQEFQMGNFQKYWSQNVGQDFLVLYLIFFTGGGKLLISIKRAMNSSRIELLWLVWDQSRSKYYLRTKFQDGIDKPQKWRNVCYHPTHQQQRRPSTLMNSDFLIFFIDVFDACFYCLLMFSFCLFQYWTNCIPFQYVLFTFFCLK